MKFVKAWEEKGVEVPAPYQRRIKVLMAPDKKGVKDITLSHAILPPGGKTDFHSHDRPELILVDEGEGICVHDEGEMPVCKDMAMWVATGENHQMVNTGYAPLKLITVFIPGYTADENYNRCVDAARKADTE